MELTLSALASQLGLALQGSDRIFSGLNTLEAATESEISFLSNPKYVQHLASSKACAVIVSQEFAPQVAGSALISDNPYRDFARAAAFFAHKHGEETAVNPLSVIHPTAQLGKNVVVYPHAFIGPRACVGNNCIIFPGAYIGEDCSLGDNCIIYPNAVIMAGVTLGKDCILHPGAVLGADGFGFVRVAGQVQKIPQIGTVVLADGVDVGANSCIDRSTLGATRIGKDTKIDNLVQIGHNVEVGEHCFLISQVGIAGSTKTGNRVTLAGQAGIAGHLHIGDDVTVGPQAGVAKDIPAGTSGSGSPFMEGRTFMRNAVVLPKLADMYRRLQLLEKELASLKTALSNNVETS